jgi:hypothetical protein
MKTWVEAMWLGWGRSELLCNMSQHCRLLFFLYSHFACLQWVWCWGPGDNQIQARELILGPCLGAKARLLSFNRTQSRDVIGLLTGNSTLRRHLHLLGLSDSPLCRRSRGRNLSPHSLWVWNYCFTQTCISGLLLLGARGHQECKPGGHLEL